MAEPLKRSRGRPKGTGKDDSALLAAVADLLLIENIRPTTAMKRLIRQGVQKKTILESATASTLRRLQEKWLIHHVVLSAEAQERLDARKAKEKEERERQQRRSHGGGGYYVPLSQMGDAIRDLLSHGHDLGICGKAMGAAFPHTALSGLDSVSVTAKVVEAAGIGRLAEGALGGIASRLSSTFPPGLNDLGAMNALNKPAQAWDTTALQEGAIQSIGRQGLAGLGIAEAAQAQARALAAGVRGYDDHLKAAYMNAASQVLGETRHPWEETREQEAIRKIATGTYDPLTGRYK